MTTSLSAGETARRRPVSHAPQGFPTVWFVAAVVLAVALSSGSYLAYKHYHATYQATAAIYFDQPREVADAADAGTIQKLSQIRLLYGGLVKTDVMTKPIADRTGLPQGLIASSVFTTTQPNSLLLVVGAQRPNTTQAKLIAEDLAEQVAGYVKEVQDTAKVPQTKQVVATIVLHPHRATQTSPTNKRRLSVAILTGILVFAIVLGVGALVRRRI